MSVNRVILLGFCGKDPEVKTVGDNKVATFSMAMTEKGYKTKDGKEITDRTEWVNIVAWRGLASLCEGYVKKGSQLYVEGRLTTRSYEKDGTKIYVTEVVAENIQLCGSKPKEEKSEPEKYASALHNGGDSDDDPLPF